MIKGDDVSMNSLKTSEIQTVSVCRKKSKPTLWILYNVLIINEVSKVGGRIYCCLLHESMCLQRLCA